MTSPEHMRVAVYYAPAADDSLFAEGATWLGRDPESGAPTPQPDIEGIDEVTAEPRLYGFHATLKPPMRLRPGIDWQAVLDTAHEVAAGIAPFDLPALRVAELSGFLALRETEPRPELQALADLCVAGFDPLRAPSDDAELTRRRRARLSPAQHALLARWGYPYVFSAWFFHMTLTRRLTEAEQARYRPAAERHFFRALVEPRRVTDLCLFTQAAPEHPFLIAERIPLRG